MQNIRKIFLFFNILINAVIEDFLPCTITDLESSKKVITIKQIKAAKDVVKKKNLITIF